MKKFLMVFTVVLLTAGFAMGQTEYKGKVSTKKGNDPIGLATIKVLDNSGHVLETVSTDGNGKFNFTAPADAVTIEISKKGYKPRTLALTKKKKIKIKMLKE